MKWILLLIFLGFILALQIPGFAGNQKEIIKERASDVWITAKVRAALMNDKRIKSWYIDINTFDGVVTLAGAVRSQEERDLVFQTVASIKGVTDVRDVLLVYEKLGEECSYTYYSDQAKDILITTKVRAILTVEKIESLRTLEIINVDTCNRVVIVVGKVKSEREKELTIKSIEDMKDVVKVVALITVLPIEI